MRYESLTINETVRSGKDKTEHGTVMPIVMAATTNGTTPVNVFSSKGCPFPSRTLVAVQLTALDTTAGNIVLKHGSNAVFTLAKGTTANAVLGPASLANATVTAGQAVTVESSSAGNATVVLIYA